METADAVKVAETSAASADGSSGASDSASSDNGGDKSSFKKLFVSAVRKNNVITKMQQLGELKDVVAETELEKAGQSIRSFRDRFQKSRPNSMCDRRDMVPADQSARNERIN